MRKTRRRFELMLPLEFNDGRPVPEELHGEAVVEILAKFGGASFQKQPIEGHWIHAGVHYQDTHAKLVVDVPNAVKNRAWMKKFKERWKVRLEQIEIWMVSYLFKVE
jgi:hypothetical protein